jgi:hypothetical protein
MRPLVPACSDDAAQNAEAGPWRSRCRHTPGTATVADQGQAGQQRTSAGRRAQPVAHHGAGVVAHPNKPFTRS